LEFAVDLQPRFREALFERLSQNQAPARGIRPIRGRRVGPIHHQVQIQPLQVGRGLPSPPVQQQIPHRSPHQIQPQALLIGDVGGLLQQLSMPLRQGREGEIQGAGKGGQSQLG